MSTLIRYTDIHTITQSETYTQSVRHMLVLAFIVLVQP